MKTKYFLAVICMLVVGGAYLFQMEKASAAFYDAGRPSNTGYFDGQYYPNGYWAFWTTPSHPYTGMTPDWNTVDMNTESFIEAYRTRLYSMDFNDAAPAAAEILIMLGVPGPDPVFNSPTANRTFNGIGVAQSRFNEWANIVRYYESRGAVNFNGVVTQQPGERDWLIGTDATQNIRSIQLVSITLALSMPRSEKAVIFTHPDGQQLVILKKCANMSGQVTPLVPPPTITACAPLAVSNPNPIAGSTSIQVTTRITYSGGRGGNPAFANTAFKITPQFPDGIYYTGSFGGGALIMQSGAFTPTTAGTYTVEWQAQLNESFRRCSATFVVYPPTITNCGTLDLSPDQPEVNQPFRAVVNASFSGGDPSPTLSNTSMNISGPPTNLAPTGVISGVSPGSVTLTSAQTSRTGPGAYTITWQFQVNEKPSGVCSETVYILAQPYFDVNGGDVVAGAAFSTTAGTPCASSGSPHNPEAGVVSWNRKTPGFAGAGTDYATFAMGLIQEFATSRANGAAANALSFANTGTGVPAYNPPNSGLFGGMFDKVANCVDYWGNKPDDGQLQSWGASNVSSASAGQYRHPGGLRLGGGQINPGERITLYVNGDVLIDGSIDYSGSNGWSRPDQIQSFTLIARGNIYLSNNVGQLDGVYVAIPTSNDYGNPSSASTNTMTNPRAGTILTCAPNTGPPFRGYTAQELADNNNLCKGSSGDGSPSLTVNGSFIAAQLFLLRTNGSLTTTVPAEVFNYSPEVWLAPSGGRGVQSGYDAIIGLPPVL